LGERNHYRNDVSNGI